MRLCIHACVHACACVCVCVCVCVCEQNCINNVSRLLYRWPFNTGLHVTSLDGKKTSDSCADLSPQQILFLMHHATNSP